MRDQKGNEYEKVSLPNGTLRLTYVPDGWPGGTTIRLQVRDDAGHLRLGPEIPINTIGPMVGAIVNLLHRDLPQPPVGG